MRGILSLTATTNGSGQSMNAPTGKCLRPAYLNDKSFGPVCVLAFQYGPCFRLVVVGKLVRMVRSGFSECLFNGVLQVSTTATGLFQLQPF